MHLSFRLRRGRRRRRDRSSFRLPEGPLRFHFLRRDGQDLKRPESIPARLLVITTTCRRPGCPPQRPHPPRLPVPERPRARHPTDLLLRQDQARQVRALRRRDQQAGRVRQQRRHLPQGELVRARLAAGGLGVRAGGLAANDAEEGEVRAAVEEVGRRTRRGVCGSSSSSGNSIKVGSGRDRPRRGIFLGRHAQLHACVAAGSAGAVHVDLDVGTELEWWPWSGSLRIRGIEIFPSSKQSSSPNKRRNRDIVILSYCLRIQQRAALFQEPVVERAEGEDLRVTVVENEAATSGDLRC